MLNDYTRQDGVEIDVPGDEWSHELVHPFASLEPYQ